MENETFDISLELLREMFLFVELLGVPATTIDEFFNLEWKLDNEVEILLQFKNHSTINYIISRPNPKSYETGTLSPDRLILFLKDYFSNLKYN